jgi:hypothetical protein
MELVGMTKLSDIAQSIVSRVAFWDRHPLKDRGFGLIYDRVRNITWLQDANYAKTVGHTKDGQMTWYQAMTWVKSLSYHGVNGWRLPSAHNSDGTGPCIGDNCNDSEMGFLFLVESRTDVSGIHVINGDDFAMYWNATEASETEAFAWSTTGSRQGTLPKDPFHQDFPAVPLLGPVLAWPIHDGDVSTEIFKQLLTFKYNVVRRLLR